MSIYPATNSMFNLRVPMPIPRTANAPFFNGRYIDDFLNRVILHASQAGKTDQDSLVKYILYYASDQVKDTIINMDEFDVDNPQTLKWSNAKEALYSLYGSTDKPKDHSEEELKDFCKKKSAESNFTKLSHVESYFRDFVGIAASLKKRGLITDKRYDYYFVLGLPHSMKDWFLNAAPETKRTRDDPPTVAESLKILKTRFDKQSLIYEEWNVDNVDQVKSSFDNSGNRVTVSVPQQNNVLDNAMSQQAQNPQQTATQNRQSTSLSPMDELTKRMDALTLAISGRNRPLRCFVCGNPCGQDGVHPTGPRFCPETSGLLTERLMSYDAQRNRYVLPDGNDLPRTPQGWSGGVAAYLRHLRNSSGPSNSNTQPTRDEPPHMRSTHSIGLMYDDSEVLGGNGFGLDHIPNQYTANPATRSGLDTTNRLDPTSQINRPDRYKRGNQAPNDRSSATPSSAPPPIPPTQQTQTSPNTQVQPPTQQVRFAPQPSTIPNPNKPINIPPPSNPINTNQGWKASRPGVPRGGNQDVQMKDVEDKRNPTNAQYHFTSKVQDYADPQSMISRIGDIRIEVPLFQLLGLSPALSKQVSEYTRTKREYGVPKEATSKSAESLYFDSANEHNTALSAVAGTMGPDSSASHVYVDENDPVLNDFVFRCSNAAAQIPRSRFFAMTVGDVKININGTDFLAMIDSGLELNVAGDHLPEAASLPMDFDGMRWSLKGVNGDFERLRGCAIDAPIQIGGHDFPHHIFISRQPIGRHDIILGQPFLQAFSARLDYEKGSHCKMYLWKDGEKNGRPTLMISITDPNSPRNAPAIRLGKDANTTSAYVEEVQDQEDFQY